MVCPSLLTVPIIWITWPFKGLPEFVKVSCPRLSTVPVKAGIPNEKQLEFGARIPISALSIPGVMLCNGPPISKLFAETTWEVPVILKLPFTMTGGRGGEGGGGFELPPQAAIKTRGKKARTVINFRVADMALLHMKLSLNNDTYS
jgi:hypothetical protein